MQGEWDLPLAILFIGLSKLQFWAWALDFGLYTGTVPLHFFFLKGLLQQAHLQHLTSTDISKCSFISLWDLRIGLHWGVEMRWKMEVTKSLFWRTWQLSEAILTQRLDFLFFLPCPSTFWSVLNLCILACYLGHSQLCWIRMLMWKGNLLLWKILIKDK